MDGMEIIARELGKDCDIRVEYITPVRALSSYRRGLDRNNSDTDVWYQWIEKSKFRSKVYGNHDHFACHDVKTGDFVCGELRMILRMTVRL